MPRNAVVVNSINSPAQTRAVLERPTKASSEYVDDTEKIADVFDEVSDDCNISNDDDNGTIDANHGDQDIHRKLDTLLANCVTKRQFSKHNKRVSKALNKIDNL